MPRFGSRVTLFFTSFFYITSMVRESDEKRCLRERERERGRAAREKMSGGATKAHFLQILQGCGPRSQVPMPSDLASLFFVAELATCPCVWTPSASPYVKHYCPGNPIVPDSHTCASYHRHTKYLRVEKDAAWLCLQLLRNNRPDKSIGFVILKSFVKTFRTYQIFEILFNLYS